jgi:hypothetical protein
MNCRVLALAAEPVVVPVEAVRVRVGDVPEHREVRPGNVLAIQVRWRRRNAVSRVRGCAVPWRGWRRRARRGWRRRYHWSAAGRREGQHGMELDPVRRDSPLAMLVVEEADPGDGRGARQVREARARDCVPQSRSNVERARWMRRPATAWAVQPADGNSTIIVRPVVGLAITRCTSPSDSIFAETRRALTWKVVCSIPPRRSCVRCSGALMRAAPHSPAPATGVPPQPDAACCPPPPGLFV